MVLPSTLSPRRAEVVLPSTLPPGMVLPSTLSLEMVLPSTLSLEMVLPSTLSLLARLNRNTLRTTLRLLHTTRRRSRELPRRLLLLLSLLLLAHLPLCPSCLSFFSFSFTWWLLRAALRRSLGNGFWRIILGVKPAVPFLSLIHI